MTDFQDKLAVVFGGGRDIGGAIAVELARRGAPRLLIVDLSLPRVDGFAVVRKIRRQASDIETRIVVVAAHESLRAAARELAAPLAIAAVLPLDIDAATLADLLRAESRAMRRVDSPLPPPPVAEQRSADLDDVIDGVVEVGNTAHNILHDCWCDPAGRTEFRKISVRERHCGRYFW